MECIKLILKNLFNTQIRLGVKGYLIWNLLVLGIVILAGTISYLITGQKDIILPSMQFIAIIFTIPNIVLTIGRLHDLGLSGWWILLLTLPLIGSIFGLFVLFFPSKKENNKYENLPKIC